MASAAIILLLRVPYLLAEPRMWAEEGKYFFEGAWNSNGWSSLFETYHFGYYLFYDNVVALFTARLIPLEYAPYSTMLAAWLVQLIPIAIICFGRSENWLTPTNKTIGVLAVLFTRLSGEVWLTTTSTQFHFCLVVFLLLLEPTAQCNPPCRLKYWSIRMLLVVSGLTGVPSLFLTPLYYFLAWKEKERERIIQSAILTACFIIQLSVLLLGSVPNDRFSEPGLVIYPCLLLVKNFALPLGGMRLAGEIAWNLKQIKPQGGVLPAIALLSFIAQLAFWVYWSRSLIARLRVVFIGGLLLITFCSYLCMLAPKWGAVSALAGQRYFYVPNVIFVLLLASSLRSDKTGAGTSHIKRIAGGVLVSLAIIGGIVDYRWTAIQSPAWPQWRTEVRQWRIDPNHLVRQWPDGWGMHWELHLKGPVPSDPKP